MSDSCPFCNPPEREIVIDYENGWVILQDRYPVSAAHYLVVNTSRHVGTIHELEHHEVYNFFHLIQDWTKTQSDRLLLDGWNIGWNQGIAAGQTVDHFHVHLIGRQTGDVEDPVGGIRNVFPGKGNYLAVTSTHGG